MPPSASRFSTAKSSPTNSICCVETSVVVVTVSDGPPWVFTLTSPWIASTLTGRPSPSFVSIVSDPCRVSIPNLLASFSSTTPVPAPTVRPSPDPVTTIPACCLTSFLARSVTLSAVNAESTRSAPVLFHASALPCTSEVIFRDRLSALSFIFTSPEISGVFPPSGTDPFTTARAKALSPCRSAVRPTVAVISFVTRAPFFVSFASRPAFTVICSGAVILSSITTSVPAVKATSPVAVTAVVTVSCPASRLVSATFPLTVSASMPAARLLPAWARTSTLPPMALTVVLLPCLSVSSVSTPFAVNSRNVLPVLASVIAFPLVTETLRAERSPLVFCTMLPFSEVSVMLPPPE